MQKLDEDLIRDRQKLLALYMMTTRLRGVLTELAMISSTLSFMNYDGEVLRDLNEAFRRIRRALRRMESYSDDKIILKILE